MVTKSSMSDTKLAVIKRVVCELADVGDSPKETADMAMYVLGAAMSAANMTPKVQFQQLKEAYEAPPHV